MRFTDHAGHWQAVSAGTPLPAGVGTVLEWLNDDFNTAVIGTNIWAVTGSPTVASSELTIGNGHVLLSIEQFRAPCLMEAVATMVTRAAGDDFRLGFYRDDNNLAEFRFTGTTATNADTLLRAGGTAADQTAINMGLANGTYRMLSIYVGIGEVIWSARAVNSTITRNEAYRYHEHGIPDGPFVVRMAGLAGTSTFRVHAVRAYQLADIIPPGALGHHADALALPVRLTNGPFVASPSAAGLGYVQVGSDTASALAAGAVSTGATRSFFSEQLHLQCFFNGDQPFAAWLEAQIDGSNWQTVWYGTSVDATADAVVRYYVHSPIMQLMGSRSVRMKVRNNGASSGTFRCNVVATQL